MRFDVEVNRQQGLFEQRDDCLLVAEAGRRRDRHVDAGVRAGDAAGDFAEVAGMGGGAGGGGGKRGVAGER